MQNPELLSAIRDFFYYGTEEKLKRSYSDILRLTDNKESVDIDWEREEFIFNRLFVGPAKPSAPPIASVYIDPEEAVQGSVTREVRAFYRSVGLSLAEEGVMPEDTLALELDACSSLMRASENTPEALDIYKRFIKEHIALWLPEFLETALNNCENSTAVKDVLIILEDWLLYETGQAIISKELS